MEGQIISEEFVAKGDFDLDVSFPFFRIAKRCRISYRSVLSMRALLLKLEIKVPTALVSGAKKDQGELGQICQAILSERARRAAIESSAA